jgi:hypothetical protein
MNSIYTSSPHPVSSDYYHTQFVRTIITKEPNLKTMMGYKISNNLQFIVRCSVDFCFFLFQCCQFLIVKFLKFRKLWFHPEIQTQTIINRVLGYKREIL